MANNNHNPAILMVATGVLMIFFTVGVWLSGTAWGNILTLSAAVGVLAIVWGGAVFLGSARNSN